MAVQELSGSINKTDKWSGVISREAPVDANHAIYPIGNAIMFNEAYRQLLYQQDNGNGKIAFVPDRQPKDIKPLEPVVIMEYARKATLMRRFIKWKLGHLKHERGEDHEEVKDEELEVPIMYRGV